MNNTTSWQDFCLLYYDEAMADAKYHLNKLKSTFPHWDSRIDEEAICYDAAIEALQKAFTKFDPARGAKVETFLGRLVHNELVDELKKETKSLSTLNDINASQEADYTFREMVSRIPEKTMEALKQRLRAAILKLSPIDQCILGFFLEDPSSFIEKSVNELHVTPGFVSVHKNRAIAKLPALMNMDAEDYFSMFEQRQHAGFMMTEIKTVKEVFNINPVYPEFDLDGTVMRLMHAINSVRSENS